VSARSRVAILMPDPYLAAREYHRPFLTLQGDDVWNGTRFCFNPKDGEFDAIVVYQSVRPLDRPYRLRCPQGQTLLVLLEPPDILHLPAAYTRQFECTLGQDARARSRQVLIAHSGHFWFVEMSISEAEKAPISHKPRLLSAVTSNKTSTTGHRRRLKLLGAIKEEFGDDFDWFGRGVRHVPSKLEGLAPYKYHIVLENGEWPHYWTEKLADAYVANCFPFYWGAPNVVDYFPSQAHQRINIDDIAGTLITIKKVIADGAYFKSQNVLAEARRRVLHLYHPYATYLRILDKLPRKKCTETVILPHDAYRYSLSERLSMRFSGAARRFLGYI
jgi:hypothetical protein